MEKKTDTYKEVRTFVYPDWGVIRVHIPDLDEAERARRMKVIHDAAVSLLKSVERQKREKQKGLV